MGVKITKPRNLELHGIRNAGNTCFFNASIQCLLSLPKIVSYFLTTTFDPVKQPFSTAFQTFIFDYRKNKVVNPHALISSIRTGIRLFNGRQQDAHVFLESFISKLCDESDIFKGNRNSDIKKLLMIQQEDNVRCNSCGFVSVVKVGGLMQYLFIKDSVQGSIDYYFKTEETIDEESPWKCTSCSQKSESTITHLIKNTSEYFIIYLNRFQSISSKNNAYIEVNDRIRINEINYEVVGMVCHSGVLSGGHYYSFCKRDKWAEFNDSHVKKIEAPNMGGNTAYLLFYSAMN
ncbi:Inactive ubiquitin carboxyl-terminal hydrolase 50 [Glugoides intestinalis]